MKKIILVIVSIFLFYISDSASASRPFSKTIRNDGVEINKCVDDFGKIDYCTVYDRNHAEEITKYPQKYSVVEEKLIQNTNQKPKTQTFGENCMNVQYAVGTVMTLFNSVVNAVNIISTSFRK